MKVEELRRLSDAELRLAITRELYIRARETQLCKVLRRGKKNPGAAASS